MSRQKSKKERKEGDRLAGILVPVFSIRTADDTGIGDTNGLREFTDLAADLGIGFIQLLPVNEIGPDNSPYNAISSVAIEPMTIDCRPGTGLADLTEKTFSTLTRKHKLSSFANGPANYSAVRKLKRDLLEAAFSRFRESVFGTDHRRNKEFLRFCEEEEEWLDDYCVFRFLMELEEGNPDWQSWSEEYCELDDARSFIESAIQSDDPNRASYWMLFFAYVQWIARSQWKETANHARKRGVKLMGDIPIGISCASADVFANREIFDLDWYGGAPPEKLFKDDEFVQKWGQNWGIPVYRWNVLKENDYAWWRQRIRKTTQIFDMFRIDHALGFYRIYSFPWNPVRNDEFLLLGEEEAAERCQGRRPGFLLRPDDTEENKAANLEQGEEYLSMIKETAGDCEIIAEDLGMVPDYVRPNLAKLKIAGMKVPQWEFQGSAVLPGTEYPEISFAAYTTHDHASLKVQWNEAREQLLNCEAGSDEWNEASRFLNSLLDFSNISVTQFDEFPEYDRNFLDALHWNLSRSKSNHVAFLISDWLYSSERINVPGIMSENNWTYRVSATVEELKSSQDWEWMREMTANILTETERSIHRSRRKKR